MYREIQNKQFPPLRKKSLDTNRSNPEPQNSSNVNPTRPSHPNSLVTEGVTFAQTVCQNRTNEDTPILGQKTIRPTNDSENLCSIIQSSFERFEKILSKQSEQVSTLLNLLTSVISRLR